MRKILYFGLILAVGMAFLPIQISRAVTAVGSPTFDSATDNGSCTGTVVFDLAITLNTDDGGGKDYFGFWVEDAVGTVIEDSFVSDAVGTTYTQFDVAFGGSFGNVVQRPVKAYLIDYNASKVTVAVIAEIEFDPADYIGSCKTLPHRDTYIDPLGDQDNDGVLNKDDNCIFVPNPGQEDGWGTAAGDLCDEGAIYDTGKQIKAFQQKSGVFHIHGACFVRESKTECPVIAIFDPIKLQRTANGQRFTTNEAAGWYVDVYYRATDSAGNAIFQINSYGDGALIDDLLEIVVRDGNSIWRRR